MLLPGLTCRSAGSTQQRLPHISVPLCLCGRFAIGDLYKSLACIGIGGYTCRFGGWSLRHRGLPACIGWVVQPPFAGARNGDRGACLTGRRGFDADESETVSIMENTWLIEM